MFSLLYSLKQPKQICWIVDYNLFTRCHHMQPYDKARNAVALALSPVVRALIDPDGAMVDIRNLDSVRTIFAFYCFHIISYTLDDVVVFFSSFLCSFYF